MDSLIDYIKKFHPVQEEVKDAIHNNFEEKVLAKNELLVRHGSVCRHLFFLEKGAMRGYYDLEEKEVTHWFGFDGNFVTSFHSFITGEPAVENIQALEGCILWSISRDKLNNLFNQFHEIERIVRKAYEKYYIRLEERFVNAQFKTATERYVQLVDETPHIINRVPLGYIASYLGISAETLSRIRSKL